MLFGVFATSVQSTKKTVLATKMHREDQNFGSNARFNFYSFDACQQNGLDAFCLD